MNNEIVCDNCGGTDFYKESGYYYCSECQVQTQELQEQLYRENVIDFENIKSKKGKGSGKKNDDRITTWECYNYALLGLTNELINLGANPKIKKVVKILWLKYLEKLQVFKRGKNVTPKLQAVSYRLDAEVVYGINRKRKRGATSSKSSKSSSDDLDSTVLDTKSLKRESAKKKRALIEAFSQEVSQRTENEYESGNETLQSVQSDKSSRSSGGSKLVLNKYARKALRKKVSKHRLKLHEKDPDNSLRLNSTHLMRYIKSVHFLSPKKLYVLLYAALLIVSDKMHLNDLLNFIDNGHLTYNDYFHFFPEEFLSKTINKLHHMPAKLSWDVIHTQTMQLAKSLQVTSYFQCPNLIELASRYCTELNLPKELCHCVQNIISRAKINTNFAQSNILATNYTGRVLSVILVVLKLFFALDDMTEHSYAKLAHILNQSKRTRPKIFDIVAWLKHIEYRQLFIQRFYFPAASASESKVSNLDGLYELISKKKSYVEYKKNRDDLSFLLGKLTENGKEPKFFNFPASLTPYRDYTRLLCSDPDVRQGEFLFEILEQDFDECSIAHVLRPDKLLEAANGGESPKLVHHGANNKLKFEKIRDVTSEEAKFQTHRSRNVLVEVTREPQPKKLGEEEPGEVNIDKFLQDYEKRNLPQFAKNLHRSRKYTLGDASMKTKKIRKDLARAEKYPEHFIAYERYWMRFMLACNSATTDVTEWGDFLAGFPRNFQLVFGECLRISKQSTKTLLFQFIFTEMYLVYATEKFSGVHPNEEVAKKFLQSKIHLW